MLAIMGKQTAKRQTRVFMCVGTIKIVHMGMYENTVGAATKTTPHLSYESPLDNELIRVRASVDCMNL